MTALQAHLRLLPRVPQCSPSPLIQRLTGELASFHDKAAPGRFPPQPIGNNHATTELDYII